MEINCGTDIIEISRIKEAIENIEFINKVFTKSEQEYCEKFKLFKEQHYAGRFAAKEAILKAVSKKIKEYTLEWKDIEIVNDKSGRPQVKLKYDIVGLKNIDVSISHCKEYAVAFAVAEFKK